MIRSMRAKTLAATAAPLLVALSACGGGGSGETVKVTDAAGNTTSVPRAEYSKSIDAQISAASAAKASGEKSRAATATPDSDLIYASFLYSVHKGVSITGTHNGKTVSNACTAAAEKYKQWIPGGVKVRCVDSLYYDRTWNIKPGELYGITAAAQYIQGVAQGDSGVIEVLNSEPADRVESTFLHELGHSYEYLYLRDGDRLRIAKAVKGPSATMDDFHSFESYGKSPQEAWARAFPRCMLNKIDNGVDPKGIHYVTLDCSLVKQIFSEFEKTYKTNIDIIDTYPKAPPKPLHDRKGFDPYNMNTW